MALSPFNFVKLLTDVIAFPKPFNRAKLQQLHTETQTYINNSIVPDLNKALKGSGQVVYIGATTAYTLPANSYSPYSITFPPGTFTQPPIIIPFIVGQTFFTVGSNAITKDGFNLEVRNLYSGQLTGSVGYIAIGS